MSEKYIFIYIYLSFIQSYLIYINSMGEYESKETKNIYSKQKHASRVIFQEDKRRSTID